MNFPFLKWGRGREWWARKFTLPHGQFPWLSSPPRGSRVSRFRHAELTLSTGSSECFSALATHWESSGSFLKKYFCQSLSPRDSDIIGLGPGISMCSPCWHSHPTSRPPSPSNHGLWQSYFTRSRLLLKANLFLFLKDLQLIDTLRGGNDSGRKWLKKKGALGQAGGRTQSHKNQGHFRAGHSLTACSAEQSHWWEFCLEWWLAVFTTTRYASLPPSLPCTPHFICKMKFINFILNIW